MRAMPLIVWTIICLLQLVGVGLIAASFGAGKWGQWAAGTASMFALCWFVSYVEKSAGSAHT